MSVIALPSSIMVRMLVADDAICLFRPVILQRGLARQIGDANHPAEPGFGSILPGWYDLIRPVERTGHDLDPRAVDAAEAERRATIPAKVTHGDGGRLKRRRLAAGPGEIGILDVGEVGERRTGGLLAHQAMTDADLGRQPRQRKADGAALAAAGQDGLGLLGHAHSIRRQASCSVASASPPAKMKSSTPAARKPASCPPGRPAR